MDAPLSSASPYHAVVHRSSGRPSMYRPHLSRSPATIRGTRRGCTLAAAMTAPTGTSRPGLSIHEAAVILGVSPNTVRRRVVAGSLRSERIARPQGEAIRVYLDHVPGEVPQQVPPEVVPGDVPNEVPPTSQPQVPDADRAEAMAALISASIVPVLAPLVGQLDASRQTVERQAERLVVQAETIGRQSAELERLRALEAAYAAHGPVARNLTPETPDPTPRAAHAAPMAPAAVTERARAGAVAAGGDPAGGWPGWLLALS